MQYLIGYDISDPKRLQKIHRKMRKFATPLQYSIFLLEGTNIHLDKCLAEVLKILHKTQDDLRVYPISPNLSFFQLGKSVLPEGFVFSSFLQNSIN